ncbi:MAG: hypothetical protein KDE35_06280 [Geminicoccaceae bacterium]|nr:hypothetical protein [Geminicoccaceae bacterium]
MSEPRAPAFQDALTFADTEATISRLQATLTVTTLDDVVDATDGVLSLREAVGEANARTGADTITFADALHGGSVRIEGPLGITDDLVVDGDPADGGSSSIGLRFAGENSGGFDVRDAAVTFEDLGIIEETIDGGSPLRTVDSSVRLERVDVRSGGEYSSGIGVAGGSLEIVDGSVGAYAAAVTAIGLSDGARLIVEDSLITAKEATGEIGGSAGIGGNGEVVLSGSTIDVSTSPSGNPFGVDGVVLDGRLTVTNSTIVAGSGNGSGDPATGITLEAGGTASLTSVTIAARAGSSGDLTGIEVAPSADLTLAGSLVTGGTSVDGTFTDGGGNVLGDRDGVAAGDVFESGTLADNGGPTPTLALREDASNPAIGGADPATAEALDQRGFARDAAPDSGAFEAGAGPVAPPVAGPLPDLVDGRPLADSAINGVDRAFFTLDPGTDATFTFLDEGGRFVSTLGVYRITDDGTITDPKIVFAGLDTNSLPDAPVDPGDQVSLSDLYGPGAFAGGGEFGLFLIADGFRLQPELVDGDGRFEFRDGDEIAHIGDAVPKLVHIAGDGRETLVDGAVVHTVDAGAADPLSNALNPSGRGQVVSGLQDDAFVVAFEDVPLGVNDGFGGRDFNDVLIAVDVEPDMAPPGMHQWAPPSDDPFFV